MIAMLSAVVALLTGVSNISTGNGRHYPHAAIARTATVELQRHSPAVKEVAAAKDVPVVSTAKAGNKSKHYKTRVFARRPNNGYGYALGYGEESGGPRGFFFR